MSDTLSCFKAYDIRGRVPEQLNQELARRIGRAYATVIKPRRVVLGHDIRLSSAELTDALCEGLTMSGVDVAHIGLCGTEEVYFATSHLGADGGIMVTASHNPSNYNGMKLVRGESRPISGDSGLREIERVAARGEFASAPGGGSVTDESYVRGAYLEHLMGYVDQQSIKPLTIVSNPGNGCAGPVVEALAERLPFRFQFVQHEPDGRFPNGVPNPLLVENRSTTTEAVRSAGADFGVAWDGDFDRCFFFDERGAFVEGYYIVGLLASQILATSPGERVIYDPRLTWNSVELIEQHGGIPVQCKTGHAFIKERMRQENAVYGGEMSAHHYFREFSYCDSGMIPWLLVAGALGRSGNTLSQLVGEMQQAYPVSGEINRRVDGDLAIQQVRERYEPDALRTEWVDGLSLEFSDWRLNIRKSNTEPLVRLNVESRGDRSLMEQKTAELLALIDSLG